MARRRVRRRSIVAGRAIVRDVIRGVRCDSAGRGVRAAVRAIAIVIVAGGAVMRRVLRGMRHARVIVVAVPRGESERRDDDDDASHETDDCKPAHDVSPFTIRGDSRSPQQSSMPRKDGAFATRRVFFRQRVTT